MTHLVVICLHVLHVILDKIVHEPWVAQLRMTVHKIKGNHYTNTAMNFNGTISEGLNEEGGGGGGGGGGSENHLPFKFLPTYDKIFA